MDLGAGLIFDLRGKVLFRGKISHKKGVENGIIYSSIGSVWYQGDWQDGKIHGKGKLYNI